MPKAKAAANPVVNKIVASAREIHQKIVAGREPATKSPLRGVSNVRHTPKMGHFEMLKHALKFLPCP